MLRLNDQGVTNTMRRYERPNRKAARSRRHSYERSGWYFVTICVAGRELLFGEVVGGEMRLNQFGHIVEQCWRELPHHYGRIRLDAFVVMPNRVHAIVGFDDIPAPTTSRPVGLPEVVRALKTESARRINNVRGSRGTSIWQRSYHDQIIRDDRHLETIRQYIHNNPTNWQSDEENPSQIQ